MNLRMRTTCLPALLALFGALGALPAKAQQAQPGSGSTTGQTTAAPKTEVAAANLPAETPAPAQTQGTPPPDQTPAATPPAPPTWSLGPIDFSGEVDVYYGYNFNQPRPGVGFGNSSPTPQNVLYNFNIPTNQFSLSMVKLGMAHAPDPVGFEVDFGYGDTMTQIRNVSNESGFDEFIENAFVSFKPAKLKGIELDFGKFVTSAGAEVIESYANWNYSRSLLFSWAIPYYHFGLRSSFPINKHWTGGFQVINGWNNVVDNNTAPSIGANITGTYGKFTWTTNWYGGSENPNTNAGWRELFDTTLTVTPSPIVAFYINYDYAWETVFNDPTGNFFNGQKVNWDGIAGAIHITPPGSKWAFSGRYEWFSDPQGFAMLNANPAFDHDGDEAIPLTRVQEFTLTAEYKFLEGLMMRGEYRYDFANVPIFSRGADPSDSIGNIKNQSTITLAAVAYFGPKR